MDDAQHNHPIPNESPKTLIDSHYVAKSNKQQTTTSRFNRRLPPAGLNENSLPNQPGNASSNIETRLMEVEQSLKNEKESHEKESILHENSIIHLQTKLKEVEQHLEMEQSRHKKTRSDLIETQKGVKHHRQLALDAVGELNRFLRGNQVPNQSTDDEIIQRAMMLRVDIRDFAIIHFEGSIDEVGINQVSLESLNEFLRIPPDCLKKYVSNSSTRVNIIRAFLWTYLCERVFNRFSWTWRGAGSAFHDICGFLEGLMNENENGDCQGKRKFHTWRANTASLLVEAMSLDETAANRDCQHLIRILSKHISHLLEPFKLSCHQDYQQGLQGILYQSIELDKEICKQIANIEWLIPEELPYAFQPNIMELDPGQEQDNDNGVVTLMLGPGLVKHGKSSGDSFDMTERLLKTHVFCDKSLGNMRDDRVLPGPQEQKGKTPGIRGKFQSYRRWIGNTLATEYGEDAPGRQ